MFQSLDLITAKQKGSRLQCLSLTSFPQSLCSSSFQDPLLLLRSSLMEFPSLSKRYLLLCLSVLFLSSFHAQATVSFKYCDKKGNYAVKVSGVEILPNPVESGNPATFKISAATGQAISGGKLVIAVSYVGLPVHTETRDLCEEASCPVSGNFVISHTQTLPSITPPGPYALKLTVKDEANELLTCIKFNFKIVLGSSVSYI